MAPLPLPSANNHDYYHWIRPKLHNGGEQLGSHGCRGSRTEDRLDAEDLGAGGVVPNPHPLRSLRQKNSEAERGDFQVSEVWHEFVWKRSDDNVM